MLHFFTPWKQQKTKAWAKAKSFLGGYRNGTLASNGLKSVSQLTITCSKSTLETLEKGVKCVQS